MRPVAGLLLLTGLTCGARTPVPAVESKLHACKVAGIADEVQCATYPVWENRATKTGRKIGLNIVVLPARGTERAPDPLFILAGGPGQASTETVVGYVRNAVRNRRDIVFIDQRGTGQSNPLDCDLFGDPPDLQKMVTYSFPVDSVEVCRARLSKIADLGLYTTDLGMDDVDEVRQWLGYGKINIWGGSYGSMAAQVYMRRHGANVRAVVLAGVAPVDELIPLHHALAGQQAVDAIFAKCRADAECNAAYPKLPQEFQTILDRVRKGVDVEVHGRDGRTALVRPSLASFAEGVRHFLYSDDGRTFPATIHEAATGGNLSPLVQMAVSTETNFNRILSMGMLLSVTCAEHLPYIDDKTLARETANTFLGDLRVKEQQAACRQWVRGKVPKDVHQLVKSNLPVLLISGARDSVTPPAFAERVAKQLPNSLHVVFPESSHGNWGLCGAVIMTDFIERGSVQGLDTGCASQQKPVKFMIR
ncbi:MAG TPA: alpha/beta hydrolase [Bryobacteraceae bacterium]|nr:alpha/beta hydrolase [Bryobacteraceae bacterium]